MSRQIWALFAVAVLAVGGCGQKQERQVEGLTVVPAPAAKEPTAPGSAEDMDGHGDGREPVAARPAPPGESGHTIGTAAAGAAIAAKVKTTLISLTAEEGLATGNLDVKAKADGTVTLTGSVPSEEQKQRIEQAALAVEGVRAVQNALTLAP